MYGASFMGLGTPNPLSTRFGGLMQEVNSSKVTVYSASTESGARALSISSAYLLSLAFFCV